MAAPVLDHRGRMVAAVMVAAPRCRVTQEQVGPLSAACTEASREVSQRLGFTPGASRATHRHPLGVR